MRTEFYWIPTNARGKLAIVPRPRGGDWLVDELRDYRAAGLDVLVSLLPEDESEELGLELERSAAISNGLEFLSFPIADMSTPRLDARAKSFIDDLAQRLEEGKRVGIHCRQSIGRSGMIAAAVLVWRGESPRSAMSAVSSARGLETPETEAQRRWVESLANRRSPRLR